MFRDRLDAASRLARALIPLVPSPQSPDDPPPLVLGIPRGGVVIGALLARELNAELDVLLARKLRAPSQPELAIGAVAEDGSVHLEPHARRVSGVTDAYLERETTTQLDELRRRASLFRAVRPPAPVPGRCVIVTDDGIATGATLIAALHTLAARHPSRLIVAVPVAPADRLDDIRRHCDQLVCLHAPRSFWAIGQFYDNFEPVDEAAVLELLRAHSHPSDRN